MTEAPVTICQNTEFTENMEKMLNNQQFGDTVFLVNNMKFFASSHLVSVSSAELESTLKIHYENCGDREIKIGEIKFEDSFLCILRFMYGLEINLSQMEKAVLCEVLCLAERFKLNKFFTQLKSYVSILDCFEVDIVVVLLNTARKFKIEELYDKLTLWSFENADQLAKHGSFVDLQYDVLLDLVKADCFFTEEINILKGILDWHDINVSNSTYENCDVTDNNFTKTQDEADIAKGETLETRKEVEQEESSDFDVYNEAIDIEIHASSSTKKMEHLVKQFSSNVLKSLLQHIRCSKISLLDMSKLMENDLYKKSKEFICDYNNFSPNTKSRTSTKSTVVNPVTVPSVQFVEKKIEDVTKLFIVNCLKFNEMYESNEGFDFENMTWKIGAKYLQYKKSGRKVHIFLNCIFEMAKDWECTVECQLRMIPVEEVNPILYLPGENVHMSVTLSSKNPFVTLGEFQYDANSWRYMKDRILTFQAHFKSIHTKVRMNQE